MGRGVGLGAAEGAHSGDGETDAEGGVEAEATSLPVALGPSYPLLGDPEAEGDTEPDVEGVGVGDADKDAVPVKLPEGDGEDDGEGDGTGARHTTRVRELEATLVLGPSRVVSRLPWCCCQSHGADPRRPRDRTD